MIFLSLFIHGTCQKHLENSHETPGFIIFDIQKRFLVLMLFNHLCVESTLLFNATISSRRKTLSNL